MLIVILTYAALILFLLYLNTGYATSVKEDHILLSKFSRRIIIKAEDIVSVNSASQSRKIYIRPFAIGIKIGSFDILIINTRHGHFIIRKDAGEYKKIRKILQCSKVNMII